MLGNFFNAEVIYTIHSVGVGNLNGGIDISLAPVPLPAAVWLFGSGLGVLGLVGRAAASKECRSVTSTPAQSFALRRGLLENGMPDADRLASRKSRQIHDAIGPAAAPTNIGRAAFTSTAATWRWAITRPRKMRFSPINGRRNSTDRTA